MRRTNVLLGIIVVVMLTLAGCLFRLDFDPERLAELHWITPPAEELVISQPIATPEPLPADATAVAIEVEEQEQTDCTIKINVNAAGELIYHMEGMAYYSRVRVDEEAGDSWACSEEEAVAAGARKSTR